ncbi:MAG: SPOR domain-containing protein [Saprospiraceae bacterium]
MSKLDTFTVLIVGLCLAALGYLVYKTIKLRELKTLTTSEIVDRETNQTLPADTTTLDQTNQTSDPVATEDADLDDEQLSVKEGTLVEEEEAKPAPKNENTTEKIAETKAEPSIPKSFDEKTTTTTKSGDFLVLAGSFKQKANAEAQVKRLKKLGFNQAEVTSFNGGILAVALVDRFDSQNEASKLVDALKAKGVDAFVKRKD